MPNWKKNLLALGLGLSLVVVFLAVVELACSRLLKSRFANWVAWSPPKVSRGAVRPLRDQRYQIASSANLLPIVNPKAKTPVAVSGYEKDMRYPPLISRVLPRGLVMPNPGKFLEEMYWKIDGKRYYSATYTIDEYSRRFTPVVVGAKPDRFALFFGCSFTFGQGIADDETLAFFFQQNAPRYQSYNSAYSGGSINDVVARLEQTDQRQGLKQSQGIGIYVFIDDHISRALGYLSDYHWTRTRPYYYRDSRGDIVSLASFAESQPVRDWFMLLIDQSALIKFFHLEWPPFTTQNHLNLFADTVLKAKREFERTFPEQPFVVVFHPLHSRQWARNLIPYFEDRKIDYLDYSAVALERLTNLPVRIAVDGHPSPEANRILGKQLAIDLQSWSMLRERHERQ